MTKGNPLVIYFIKINRTQIFRLYKKLGLLTFELIYILYNDISIFIFIWDVKLFITNLIENTFSPDFALYTIQVCYVLKV